jgi:hypothetical protein
MWNPAGAAGYRSSDSARPAFEDAEAALLRTVELRVWRRKYRLGTILYVTLVRGRCRRVAGARIFGLLVDILAHDAS